MDKIVKLITELNAEQSKMILEHISLSGQATKAEVKASNDMLGFKVDGIIKRQDIANHRVSCLEETSVIIPKNRRWRVATIFAACMLILAMCGAWAYHHLDFKKSFENITKTELKDETN